MRKHIAVLMIALMALSPGAHAQVKGDWAMVPEGDKCTYSLTNVVSSTQTNTTLTFDRDVKAIYIQNTDTANEIWVDLNDGVATAGTDGETRIDPEENRSWFGFQTHKIGIINDSGETSEVLVDVCW